MIGRYTHPEMGAIWDEQNKLRIWLEIEVLACEAQAKEGVIPAEAAETIRAKARFDPQRVLEIEKEVRHDVIAFLTNVSEHVGPESRYIHLGMTSSDVLDTALAVQMKQAGEVLVADLDALAAVLAVRAKEFKNTPMVGRTHGVHAEPTTFGLKLALWYAETLRNRRRLAGALETVSVGQISGAVGTYAHLDPSVERYVCSKLGLQPAPISTQVLQRDRHAEFMNALAVCGCSLEKFATEIRHLQKTEVLEAEEHFATGQKGSSAMPHKRNPITCERIAGLSRILRGNAVAAMENVALWHERDITHSSVERVIIPDSCILLDYMLREFTAVVRSLRVDPDAMKHNLDLTRGLIHSQSVLLALTRKGMKREDAYRMVQDVAMQAWRERAMFKDLLLGNKEIMQILSRQELEDSLDIRKSLPHIDYVFTNLGLQE